MRLDGPEIVKSSRRFAIHGLLQTLFVLSLTAGSLVVSDAYGQAPAKAVTQDIILQAKDGAEIKVTYFKSTAGQESPVVIMLHGKGGNRFVWKSYAELLQKAEFAVITVDLRGHGESSGGGAGKKPDSAVKARDYAAMIQFDMEAVKKFIYEENQNKNLNMNKLGIVAADFSTPVAVAYTEVDWEKTPFDDAPTPAQQTPRGQDVQALVLLSPESSAPGLPVSKSLNVVRTLKRQGFPTLIGVGAKNNADLASAKKVYEQLAPKKDEYPNVFLEQYDVKLRGTDLLGKNLKLEEHMFNFLVEGLKKPKSEWRDRKSKLLD